MLNVYLINRFEIIASTIIFTRTGNVTNLLQQFCMISRLYSSVCFKKLLQLLEHCYIFSNSFSILCKYSPYDNLIVMNCMIALSLHQDSKQLSKNVVVMAIELIFDLYLYCIIIVVVLGSVTTLLL